MLNSVNVTLCLAYTLCMIQILCSYYANIFLTGVSKMWNRYMGNLNETTTKNDKVI